MGQTHVIKASYHDNTILLQFLCDCGATLNNKDYYGWTALHIAIYINKPKNVKILFEYDAIPPPSYDHSSLPLLENLRRDIRLLNEKN